MMSYFIQYKEMGVIYHPCPPGNPLEEKHTNDGDWRFRVGELMKGLKKLDGEKISRNLVHTRYPFHLANRFQIFHRARQYHCRALCKIKKWLSDCDYGQTRFHENGFKIRLKKPANSRSWMMMVCTKCGERSSWVSHMGITHRIRYKLLQWIYMCE